MRGLLSLRDVLVPCPSISARRGAADVSGWDGDEDELLLLLTARCERGNFVFCTPRA